MDSQFADDFESLCSIFENASDTKALVKLFQIFHTPQEINFLIDRYRILNLLLTSDLSQREIASKLKVSISKITAGSREIQKMPKNFKQYLKRHFEKNAP